MAKWWNGAKRALKVKPHEFNFLCRSIDGLFPAELRERKMETPPRLRADSEPPGPVPVEVDAR